MVHLKDLSMIREGSKSDIPSCALVRRVRVTLASDSRMWRAHPAWICRHVNVTRKIRVRCASCSLRTSWKWCAHLPRDKGCYFWPPLYLYLVSIAYLILMKRKLYHCTSSPDVFEKYPRKLRPTKSSHELSLLSSYTWCVWKEYIHNKRYHQTCFAFCFRSISGEFL
jgi:hypothetical protein